MVENSEMRTKPGIVNDEIRFDREDINVINIWIRELSLKFVGESMELKIEEFGCLVMGTNTSKLIKFCWVCPKFCNILSQTS